MGSDPVTTSEQPTVRAVLHEADPDTDGIARQYRCDLSGDAVGWVEVASQDTYGADREGLAWRSFVEITEAGSQIATRFCEDCWSWLETTVPAATAAMEVTA